MKTRCGLWFALILGIAMRVEAAPTIVNQPQALAVTMGDQAVFSVYATGSGTLTYQWKKNGEPISNATGDYYRIVSVAYGDAGNYSVDVTDGGGTTASSAAGLSVNSPMNGDLDFGFFTNTTVNGIVRSVVMQPDGKVLIGGEFTTANGTSRGYIARLHVDGSTDFGFGNGLAGANSTVNSVALQADGKVLIGGQFTTVNGTSRGRIARLNSDGSLDTSFGNGLEGASGTVESVGLQPDGKVLIGGGFSTVNGTSRGRIARLNSDGSLDTNFGNGLAGANGIVYSVALQADGKVLIGGNYSTVNRTARGKIARLNSDGSLDTTFGNGLAGANFFVQLVALQADGKVLIGGAFTTVNGTAQRYFARLNSDGSLDTGFFEGLEGPSGGVISAALQPDGKVLIGGRFITVNGTTRGRIARLNSNGSLDTSFGNGLAGAEFEVYSVALQADGKVLIGGDFTTVNGTLQTRIARLNSDGTLDTGFGNGLAGANSSVYSVAVQSDGKVLIGGSFTNVNSTTRGRIARLNSDGTLDASFGNGLAGANTFVYSVAVQPDGKVLIGGSFGLVNGLARGRIARLNSNGSLDTSFGSGLAGANTTVNSIGVQSDGKVLIGGQFTTVNGTERTRIARLNSDGTLDTGFGNGLAGADSTVQSVALQAEGKALIGGQFTTVNGPSRARIARLNTDGSLDTGFGDGLAGADSTVQSVALQADGKALIGGGFTTVNGTARGSIARLNSDGSLDTSFGENLAGANLVVRSVASQLDGQVLIGGDFTAVNGMSQNRIARLNSDGTLDTGFGNGLTGASSNVNSVALQADGKVLIGGNFTMVNGTPRFYLARLYGAFPPATPTVDSPTAASIGATGATLGGTVVNPNNGTVTERGVFWHTSSGFAPPGTGTKVSESGTYGKGAYTVSATALPPGSTIYFVAYASNSAGSSYSSESSFLTIPAAPTATAASGETASGFNANWSAATGATNYFLDVATDSDFTSFVDGYNNLPVGNVTTYAADGLAPGTTYYYRLRAQNASGTGANSGTIAVTTLKADQTISGFLPANSSAFLTTDEVGLSATASSGLSVTFTVVSGHATIADDTNLTFTGDGEVKVVASQAGNDNWNPAPDVTHTFNVGKATPVVTVLPVAATIVYGQTLANSMLTDGEASAPGSFYWTDESIAPNAGTADQSVTFTPTDTAKYEPVAFDVSLTVDKANQGIAFDGGGWQSKTYGDVPFEITATASSGLRVSFASSDEGVATVNSPVTIAGAGTTTITASQAGNENYNAAADVQHDLKVDPLSVAILPDTNQSKTQGESDPIFAYTFNPPLVGDDAFAGALGRVPGETVGFYDYTLGTLSAGGNYELSLSGAAGDFEIKEPTSVVLYYFTAGDEEGQAVIRWRTASENNTVGFFVERWDGSRWVRVNSEIVYARGEGFGALYSLVDAGAQTGGTYRYRLVEVETDGEQVYGPFVRTIATLGFTGVDPITVASDGVLIRWLSREDEQYRILRSEDLMEGFKPIASGIPATPPENEYLDNDMGANGMYMIQVDDQ